MDWAHAYGLEVLLDMHGVIGSQNGRDHSGRVGPREFYRISQHREDSLEALAQLATRYAAAPGPVGHRARQRTDRPADLAAVGVPPPGVPDADRGARARHPGGVLRRLPAVVPVRHPARSAGLPGGPGLPLLPGVLSLGHAEVLRAAPGQGAPAGQADRLAAAQAARAGGGVERGDGSGRRWSAARSHPPSSPAATSTPSSRGTRTPSAGATGRTRRTPATTGTSATRSNPASSASDPVRHRTIFCAVSMNSGWFRHKSPAAASTSRSRRVASGVV